MRVGAGTRRFATDAGDGRFATGACTTTFVRAAALRMALACLGTGSTCTGSVLIALAWTSVFAWTGTGWNRVGGPSALGENTALVRSRLRNSSGRYSSA